MADPKKNVRDIEKADLETLLEVGHVRVLKQHLEKAQLQRNGKKSSITNMRKDMASFKAKKFRT